MIETKNSPSRRAFLSEAGRIAGVSTLAGITLPHVHAAENNTADAARAQPKTRWALRTDPSSWWPWPMSSRKS